MTRPREQDCSEDQKERALGFMGSARVMHAMLAGSSECQGINIPQMAITFVLLHHRTRLEILSKLGLIDANERLLSSWSYHQRRIIESNALGRAMSRNLIAKLDDEVHRAFDSQRSTG